MNFIFWFLSCFILLLAANTSSSADKQKYNVLFIAVDDLRPELGCYGNTVIKTPNIDRLASRGLVFNRAYVQQAVCSPSRTSLMTGLRPDTTKVWDLETNFRDHIPNVVTLPQNFIQNGYAAVGLGKIYHGGFNDVKSWSVPHWTSGGSGYGPDGQKVLQQTLAEARGNNFKGVPRKNGKPNVKGLPWESANCSDSDLPDGKTADKAIEVLRGQKNNPFFLAVGFVKPHLPFVAPKKYWDLYDPKKIGMAPNAFPPKGAPDYALTGWGELRVYAGIPKSGPLSESQAREAKHGYYAAVSYMDAQVGRVLDELEQLGLREKTIVVLWGDHGWQLGEHGLWCKHTNFEVATRAPLIVSVPKQKTAGRKTDALVEFVDIYPSLVELCGLKMPQGLEGRSFTPLLNNPKQVWKKAVFSQYPRNIPNIGQAMGYSMRTDRYRFIKWEVSAKGFVEHELYDHQTDPHENENLAAKPFYREVIKKLNSQMEAGWRAAY
jgi:iduronate 2-sulfatase